MRSIVTSLRHGTEGSIFRIHELIILLSAFLCFLISAPGPVCAESERDRIKALYLYNFLLFVDWPEDKLPDGQYIRVGIMGDPALFELLNAMDQETILGKNLIIEQMDGDNGFLKSLHVLFIGASLWHAAARILDEVSDQPVLTMSDMNGFTAMGGMVGFTYLDRRTDVEGRPKRFTVNLKAVEGAGLKIRSRLLRLSDIVNYPGVR